MYIPLPIPLWLSPVPSRFRRGSYEEAVTSVKLRVLGPLELEVDETPVPVGGSKARILLSVLAIRRGQHVSNFTLSEAMWAGERPKSAAKLIQKHVSSLRKQIGTHLVTTDDGYLLNIDQAAIDVGLFEILSSSQSEAELVEALALWRGAPYPDLADSGLAATESTRLEDLRLETELRLIGMQMQKGHNTQAIGRLEELVADNPFREQLWGTLMLAYYRSGRQTDALDAYRRLSTSLGEELGIEPSAELSDLEEKILLHDPALTEQKTPTNLPAPRDRFVGRHQDLARLEAIVAESRLATLVGPAGSGKTRLSLELGRRLMDRFDDGVWFVDFAPVASPDLVARTVAGHLGVGGLAETQSEATVADYLMDRSVALILDNCEHLLSPVASFTDLLLRDAPGVSIIVTSREPVGIEGESLFEVAPLPHDGPDSDAYRLFVERARATSPRLDLSEAESVVEEIVRRVDGMPLAIELAAARVRTFGLSELRDRLDDRFELLVGAGRDASERHRTLETAVDWSYRLLTSEEQTLLRRLSVFQGDFSLAAAETVCGYEPLDQSGLAALLGELINKSLVVSPSPSVDRPRYRLLETLREFGSRQMSESEPGQLRESHARYYASIARTEHQGDGPGRLAPDHDNLRKALRWANETDIRLLATMVVDLADFWDQVGPRSEGHEWLRRAIDVSEGLSPDARIDLHLKANDMFSSYEASYPLEYANLALSESRRIGDRMREARSLRALCWALVMEEDAKGAVEAGTKAISMFEEMDEPWELALAKERLAQANPSDPDWSIELLEESLRLYRSAGDRSREALAIYKLADQLAVRGDTERARQLGHQAIELCDELGNVHDGAHARLEYGKILRRDGDADLSIPVLEDALDQLSRSGDERCSVRTLAALGTAHIDVGNTKGARQTLANCLSRARHLDERHTIRGALAGVARIIAGDQPEAAVTLLAHANALSESLGMVVNKSSLRSRQERLDQLRDEIGELAFTDAWNRGAAIPLDEAIDFGLENLTRVSVS